MGGHVNLQRETDPLDQQHQKQTELSSSTASPTGLAGGSSSQGLPTLVLPSQHPENEQLSASSRLGVNSRGESQVASPTSLPGFESALPYTRVRDFAYPEFHPLHYGVPESEQRNSSDSDRSNEGLYNEHLRPTDDDGPPWQEDEDLASPVVKSHEVGDRISREYEFSVSSVDEIHGRAIALFDFQPENENEAPLREGQVIWVSYRHGQGWLVAEVDPETGDAGLVPEEYVQMIPPEEARRLQEEHVERQRLEMLNNDNEYGEGPINNEGDENYFSANSESDNAANMSPNSDRDMEHSMKNVGLNK